MIWLWRTSEMKAVARWLFEREASKVAVWTNERDGRLRQCHLLPSSVRCERGWRSRAHSRSGKGSSLLPGPALGPPPPPSAGGSSGPGGTSPHRGACTSATGKHKNQQNGANSNVTTTLVQWVEPLWAATAGRKNYQKNQARGGAAVTIIHDTSSWNSPLEHNNSAGGSTMWWESVITGSLFTEKKTQQTNKTKTST